MIPRLIRLRDAPLYLGMDRHRFNADVRPLITEVPIGKQGIAFDRLELDAWADEYVACNGRPSRTKGGKTWDNKRERRGSSNAVITGISKSKSEDDVFEKAVVQATSAKRKPT